MLLSTIIYANVYEVILRMSVSYDYTDLITEFKADIAEGLLQTRCYIVRGEPIEDYRPVIDYYYHLAAVAQGVKAELAKTKDVLAEMEKMNSLF